MFIKDAASKYQTTNENSSKTKQVVMLYEGILRFLNNAKIAIQENHIENRYNNIEKAIEIINGLQHSLDIENGGEIALELNRFYNTMISRLNFVIIKNESSEAIEHVIKQFKPMKEAWEEVDRQYNAGELETGVQYTENSAPDQGIEVSI